jgi:pimeloyl-ACP methyl ester carboxylesterase
MESGSPIAGSGVGEAFRWSFLQYFSGNMDNWDRVVINGFAADREVVLFDNAGVGGSGGETPASVLETTRDLISFLDALGLRKIDVVGFSLRGMIAQQLALDHPQLLRRIILLGTGPRGGEGMTFTELSVAETRDEDGLLLSASFSRTATSQAAGRAFLQRLKGRKEDRDPPVSAKSTQAQLNAIREWGTVPSRDRYVTLRSIKHKTLLVHGKPKAPIDSIHPVRLS